MDLVNELKCADPDTVLHVCRRVQLEADFLQPGLPDKRRASSQPVGNLGEFVAVPAEAQIVRIGLDRLEAIRESRRHLHPPRLQLCRGEQIAATANQTSVREMDAYKFTDEIPCYRRKRPFLTRGS